MSASVRVMGARNGAARHERVLRSRRALLTALSHAARHQMWFTPTLRSMSELILALATDVPPRVRRARLISRVRPPPAVAQVLDSSFDRTLLGAQAMLADDDITEVLRTPHPEDYCIGADWDPRTQTVALWRGDLSVVVLPLSAFKQRANTIPDPTRLSVIDCGQTLRLGKFEAAVDSLLYERDPAFRRRANRRLREEDRTLGGSIRRLRKQFGVARDSFPGLDEKTLARIERGEVARPHRATLEIIAKRLGMTVDEIGDG